MALQEVLFLMLVPVAAIIIIVLYFPRYLYKALLRLQLYMAGMTPKTLSVNGFVYSYAERGVNQPGTPSFLFLHGFSSSKEGWTEVIKYLPPNRHVVAIDLPGHGASSCIEHEEIHPMAHAHKLHQFARLHGLDKESFHVIGLSMGASVAACFAASYPTHTSHVTLCCPPIVSPNRSKFQEMIDTGKMKSLVTATVEEFDNIMKLMTYKPMNIHKQVIQGIIDSMRKNQQYLLRVFKEMSKPEARNQPIINAEKTKAPTQIVWGDSDNVIDVSGVEVLKKELDNCVRTDIIKDCGHLIYLEHPKQLASLIMALQGESQY